MGCMSSSSAAADERNSNDDASELLKQAQAQRRKLSVTPALVGDIDGKRVNPSDGKPRRVSLGADTGNETSSFSNKDEDEVCGKNFFALSKKGFVPYNRKKCNQDAFFVHHNVQEDDSISLMGVCDGHGEFGHCVSAFVKTNLITYLENQSDLRSSPEAAIINAVKQLCDALEKATINIAFSGTTLVFGLKIDQVVYVANIGDSRCVVAQRSISGDRLVAKALSTDQKPDDPIEKKRILKAGGRVEPLPGPPEEDCGPSRVWLAEVDIPGLAMSRSIGDEISHTVGVISEPEVVKYELQDTDTFLLWASDGVWEFLDNQDVVSLVAETFPDIKKATRIVVERSTDKWKEVEEVIDDITCLILAL